MALQKRLNRQAKKARKKAVQRTQSKANEFAQELYPEIKALLDAGYSYRGIAQLFNKTNRITGGSKDDNQQFSWYASKISNIIKRSKN